MKINFLTILVNLSLKFKLILNLLKFLKSRKTAITSMHSRMEYLSKRYISEAVERYVARMTVIADDKINSTNAK